MFKKLLVLLSFSLIVIACNGPTVKHVKQNNSSTTFKSLDSYGLMSRNSVHFIESVEGNSGTSSSSSGSSMPPRVEPTIDLKLNDIDSKLPLFYGEKLNAKLNIFLPDTIINGINCPLANSSCLNEYFEVWLVADINDSQYTYNTTSESWELGFVTPIKLAREQYPNFSFEIKDYFTGDYKITAILDLYPDGHFSNADYKTSTEFKRFNDPVFINVIKSDKIEKYNFDQIFGKTPSWRYFPIIISTINNKISFSSKKARDIMFNEPKGMNGINFTSDWIGWIPDIYSPIVLNFSNEKTVSRITYESGSFQDLRYTISTVNNPRKTIINQKGKITNVDITFDPPINQITFNIPNTNNLIFPSFGMDNLVVYYTNYKEITESISAKFNPLYQTGTISAYIGTNLVATAQLNGKNAQLVTITGPLGSIVTWKSEQSPEEISTILGNHQDVVLRAPLSISGYATEKDTNKPISQAQLCMQRVDDSFIKCTETLSDGYYSFKNSLIAGDYNVRITHLSYYDYTTSFSLSKISSKDFPDLKLIPLPEMFTNNYKVHFNPMEIPGSITAQYNNGTSIISITKELDGSGAQSVDITAPHGTKVTWTNNINQGQFLITIIDDDKNIHYIKFDIFANVAGRVSDKTQDPEKLLTGATVCFEETISTNCLGSSSSSSSGGSSGGSSNAAVILPGCNVPPPNCFRVGTDGTYHIENLKFGTPYIVSASLDGYINYSAPYVFTPPTINNTYHIPMEPMPDQPTTINPLSFAGEVNKPLEVRFEITDADGLSPDTDKISAGNLPLGATFAVSPDCNGNQSCPVLNSASASGNEGNSVNNIIEIPNTLNQSSTNIKYATFSWANPVLSNSTNNFITINVPDLRNFNKTFQIQYEIKSTPPKTCTFHDITYDSGKTVKAYSQENATDCSTVSKVLTCTNTGFDDADNFPFDNCTTIIVIPPKDCTLNSGYIIKSGSGRKLYQFQEATNCELNFLYRNCDEYGKLDGSNNFQYLDCKNTSTLTGNIKDNNNQPINDAHVCMSDLSNSAASYCSNSGSYFNPDENKMVDLNPGEYKIIDLREGSYKLQAQKADYETYTADSLYINQNTTLDFNMTKVAQPWAAVKGIVYYLDKTTNMQAPIAGAKICYSNASTQCITAPCCLKETTTNNEGIYHFDPIPAGKATITATADNFIQVSDGSINILPGGNYYDIPMKLVPAKKYTLSGIVTIGSPILPTDSIQVCLTSSNNLTNNCSGNVDGNGYYQISNIDKGTYNINAFFNTKQYPITTITIDGGDMVVPINIPLPPLTMDSPQNESTIQINTYFAISGSCPFDQERVDITMLSLTYPNPGAGDFTTCTNNRYELKTQIVFVGKYQLIAKQRSLEASVNVATVYPPKPLDCNIDNSIIPSGTFVTVYPAESAPNCQAISKKFLCANGSLIDTTVMLIDDNYKYLSCTDIKNPDVILDFEDLLGPVIDNIKYTTSADPYGHFHYLKTKDVTFYSQLPIGNVPGNYQDVPFNTDSLLFNLTPPNLVIIRYAKLFSNVRFEVYPFGSLGKLRIGTQSGETMVVDLTTPEKKTIDFKFNLPTSSIAFLPYMDLNGPSNINILIDNFAITPVDNPLYCDGTTHINPTIGENIRRYESSCLGSYTIKFDSKTSSTSNTIATVSLSNPSGACANFTGGTLPGCCHFLNYSYNDSNGKYYLSCYTGAGHDGDIYFDPNCSLNGQTIMNGEIKTAYQAQNSVNCQKMSKEFTCNKGVLLDTSTNQPLDTSYQFLSCTDIIVEPQPCTFFDQTKIPNGTTITAYLYPSAQSCKIVSKDYTCNNGTLSDSSGAIIDQSYKYLSCTDLPSPCLFNNILIEDSNYVTACMFQDCNDVQQRYCHNGLLDGEYKYLSQFCLIDNTRIPDGTTFNAYNANTVPPTESCEKRSIPRTCSNGVITGGDPSYKYLKCGSLDCNFNGQIILNYQKQIIFSTSSATNCQDVSNVFECYNGTLTDPSGRPLDPTIWKYLTCTNTPILKKAFPDIDLDGKADLLAVTTSFMPQWYFIRSSNQTQETIPFIANGNILIPVIGNYFSTSFGKKSLATYSLEGGTAYWNFYDNDTHPRIQFGNEFSIPVPGDYDRDELYELAVYDVNQSIWQIKNPRDNPDNNLTSFRFPFPGIPAPGDYNGDGKLDMALYRDGQWYIKFSQSNLQDKMIMFGTPNTIPIAADYNGDGITDLAFYDLQSQIHFKLLDNNSNPSTIGPALPLPYYGNGLLIVADYDGDNKADPGFLDTTGRYFMVALSRQNYEPKQIFIEGANTNAILPASQAVFICSNYLASMFPYIRDYCMRNNTILY